MKDWIKLCRSVEVDCNSVGFVMHCFDNCRDKMTKGMPRRRQRVLPGRVSWRVLDIFYLGGKSPASAGNPAIGRKICTILLKSAMEGNLLPRSVGGKSPAWAGKSAALTESLLPAVSAESPALAGSECYQPGTASVQFPIWF
ncbi:hypothetical protein V6N12_012794 [Hibiscus sabdariffa]|uniref:Uncharacterized protein n=1 Tax=Hibiscus sabdariffa TaxID=183260 RepID=A0ABR2EFF7_9ROSI